MKKSLMSRWYVKLTIIVFCIVVGYLVVKSFLDGVKEGREKAKQEELK